MKKLATLLMALATCSCQSLVDPSAYDPQRDSRVLAKLSNSVQFGVLSPPLTQFYCVDDAAAKLDLISASYQSQADDIRREQIGFDIPILGLVAAIPISAIAHAAAKETLYLGAGSAGALGLKTYVAPEARINAYSGAAQGFSCAAATARNLSTIGNYRRPSIETLKFRLQDYLANSLNGPLAADAQKALDDLDTQIAVIDSAPARLQYFAADTIRITTSKALTGAQNADAVAATLKAISTTPAASPAAGKLSGGNVGQAATANENLLANENPPKQRPLDPKLAIVETLAAVKDIGDAWGKMTTCTLQVSGAQ